MKTNEAIKELIEEKGITQTELAIKAGYKSQGNIGVALRRDIRISSLITIANALDCKVALIPNKVKEPKGSKVLTNET